MPVGASERKVKSNIVMNEAFDMLYVTSPPEMGALLAKELEELGIPVMREMRGGAYVEKSVEAGYRVCLWSRIANRALWPLMTFRAPSPSHWSVRLSRR